MKAHHTRNLSASHKSTSYYSNPSPSSATHKKKEQPDVLQTYDLRVSLNLKNKSLPKTPEAKNKSTATAPINKFSFQTKLGPTLTLSKSNSTTPKVSETYNQVAKRHFLMNNREDDLGHSERTTKEEESAQIDKKHYENNPVPSGNRAKDTAAKSPKSLGMSDLFQSDYLSRFKKKQAEAKKSSPRGPSTPGPQSKQVTHIKNKKSFDLNSLHSLGKTNLSDIFTKPASVKSSSPKVDLDTYKYKTISNADGNKQTGSALQGKASGLDKSPAIATVRVNNYVSLKHQRNPSCDLLAMNKQEVLNGSDLQKARKSSDSLDIRPSEMQIKKKIQRRSLRNLRFAVRSRAGAMQTGARKTNQDSYIAHSSFGNPDRHLFGVCDGHGSNGHMVSNFVKEILPRHLLADSQLETRPEVSFTNIFELCHQKLLFCDFDTRFSGTTCINVLINGDRIICANAGDSRAIMGFYDEEWDYLPLSSDHKPNLMAEAQRIMMAGGRIDSFKDDDGNPIGPSRVWLKDQDVPGLAMSRSIGDVVASTVGVTCRPEVKEFEITDDDKFLIVASDGVWEFIDSTEVIKIVAPFYEKDDLEGACDCLLEAALSRWEQEEENVVDDITLIIVFF